jgi:adrenodoxin-NADP+ reductase
MGPLKLAIVGGGPSSFYVASRLLSLIPPTHPSASKLRVHIYDRLWAPHGLVRYGVAPDHPEVKVSYQVSLWRSLIGPNVACSKNCVHKFDGAATDNRLRFFGNVNIGAQTSASPSALPLELSSLFRHYTHLVFATGCTVPLLHSALPPSTHCTPALSLVHWYTDHPSRPQPPPLDKVQHVSIIGQGNVSLDIARMLLTSPSVLQTYDIPEHVLEVLRRSNVKHVSIIGRRGPFQAAFTTKELREMVNLTEASMVPINQRLLTPTPGEPLTRQQSRTLQLLQKGSKQKYGTTPKTWSLDFFRSPTGLALPVDSSRPATLSLAHTALDPATNHAVATSETSALTTDLVVTSLGHRADPLHPYYDPGLGHVRNVSGRVVGVDGSVLRNVYASGWAAMGARGVLASTMLDAHAIADTVLSDWSGVQGPSAVPVVRPDVAKSAVEVMAGGLTEGDGDLERIPAEVSRGLEDGLVTTYEDWKRVDAEEIRRGEASGKERERMGWEEARQFLR